ncbi:hypothetical protein B5V02_10650 [Mesorhizobium kowhaii]|uniref:Uncharacterized protein n=1 Tax=Mesorhizobium kowhaii TaxID=1300272 RepID=A0A2W7CXJ0_9HYPH|nr:hypothetical protein B5V02_10650 [Mesorhizobium kowhaii]
MVKACCFLSRLSVSVSDIASSASCQVPDRVLALMMFPASSASLTPADHLQWDPLQREATIP